VLTVELIALVKTNLNIPDTTKDLIIKDVIQDALNYCNLAELPVEAESYIRKKVKSIISYETQYGVNMVFDIKSISVGDTSTTFNIGDEVSKETIYGLSIKDKSSLNAFRRTRK